MTVFPAASGSARAPGRSGATTARAPWPGQPSPSCSATTAAAVISLCRTAAVLAFAAFLAPCRPRRPHTASLVASACLINSASLYSAATPTPSKSRDAWRDQPGRLVEDMSREPVGRHEQILAVAAGLFARKGVAATTVRELADEVGILSGSLYHHFDSKEAMVDEILAPYLEDLREACESVPSSETDPRTRLCGLVVASLRVVEAHPHATEIYQSDVNYLSQFERFGYLAGAAQQVRKTWLGVISDGVARGVFRSDLDPGIAYRLMRDAIWLSVRWFRPTPDYPLTRFAQECTSLFLDGVGGAARRSGAQQALTGTKRLTLPCWPPTVPAPAVRAIERRLGCSPRHPVKRNLPESTQPAGPRRATYHYVESIRRPFCRFRGATTSDICRRGSGDVAMARQFQAAPPEFGTGTGVIRLRLGSGLAGAVEEPAGHAVEGRITHQPAGGVDPGVDAVDVLADLFQHHLGRHVGGRVQAVDRDLAGRHPAG